MLTKCIILKIINYEENRYFIAALLLVAVSFTSCYQDLMTRDYGYFVVVESEQDDCTFQISYCSRIERTGAAFRSNIFTKGKALSEFMYTTVSYAAHNDNTPDEMPVDVYRTKGTGKSTVYVVGGKESDDVFRGSPFADPDAVYGLEVTDEVMNWVKEHYVAKGEITDDSESGATTVYVGL